jgi:hypothetical protein
MRVRRALAIVFALGVAGVASPLLASAFDLRRLSAAGEFAESEAAYERKIAHLPHDATTCTKAGGRWARGVCFVPMQDGGAVCASAQGCDGVCMSSQESAGFECSAYLPVFGCNVELSSGGAQSVCRD